MPLSETPTLHLAPTPARESFGSEMEPTESLPVAAYSESPWAHYERWNSALAEVLYPSQQSPAPVYLDMEEQQIRQLGSRLGLAEDEVVSDLTQAVISTSDLDTAHAFRSHAPNILKWRSTARRQAPPVLPLLALFSLAAERMTWGEGMSAANYYGRLAALLNTDTSKLGQSYRQIAEPLWGSLNYWLTGLDGERGLPTAYSVGLRYVGLALSQALVRAADRERLREFFNHFDLTPGAETAPSELELLLDVWVTSQSPSPAGSNLSKLWGRANLRPRIAELAATELLDWNGSAKGSAGKPLSGVGVALTLEISTFPRRRLKIIPSISASEMGEFRRARLVGKDGSIEVTLEPLDDRSLTLDDPSVLSSSELLEGVLVLENPSTGQKLTRQPHRLMIFRRDQLSGRWIEARQVLLGEEVSCLVLKNYVDDVEALLSQVARPGWESLDEVPGLPEGWSLLCGVEIASRPMSPPSESSDLRPLIPFAVTQLRFSGGFSLPGRARNRWHSDLAPEVSATNESGSPFQLRLLHLRTLTDLTYDEVLKGEWDDNSSGSVFVDLAALDLEDGEYAIETRDSTAGSVTARREFSLQSSLSRERAGSAQVPQIIHNPTDPLAVLDADDAVETETLARRICGARSFPKEQPHGGRSSVLPGLPRWRFKDVAQSAPILKLSRPVPGSCFYTGQHHRVLDRVELDSRGRPVTSTTSGRCKYCGDITVESISYLKNRRAFDRRQSAPSFAPVVPLQRNPRKQGQADAERWKTALDCLDFVGGGSFEILDKIARQIHDSAIFVSQFVNVLEGLGRVEFRRSPLTFDIEAWSTCAPTIVDTGEFRVLTGSWNRDLLARFMRYCEGRSLDIVTEELPLGNSRTLVGATGEHLQDFLITENLTQVRHPGTTLVQLLPPLSRVVAALPRKSIEGVSALALQFFDPIRATWIDTFTPDGIGAYRTKGFVHRYFLRTESDVQNGSFAVGTPGLVKHAASMMLSQRALAAYDPRSREFIAPLGANLPGMYERVLTIETQRAGFPRRGYLIYSDVSPDLACSVAYLLEN